MGRRHKLAESDSYYLAVENMNINDVLKEMRKTAKRANQRIVELQKHNIGIPQSEAFRYLANNKGIDIGTYNKMLNVGKSEKSGLPKLRFRENLKTYYKNLVTEKGEKKALTQLKNELLITHRFLESEMTTMRGREKVSEKIKLGLAKRKMNLDSDKPLTKEQIKAVKSITDKIDQKGLNLFLSSINMMKDILNFEYKDVIDLYYEANDDHVMSFDETKTFIETALHSRNIDHMKKQLKNNSTTSYKDFVKALKEAGKEHYLNAVTGKELVKRRRERLAKKFKK